MTNGEFRTFDRRSLRGTRRSADRPCGRGANRAHGSPQRYQTEFVDLEHFHIDHALFRSIPADMMLRYGFVPLRRDGQALFIVVSDPSDLQTIDEVGAQLNTPIRVSRGHAVGDSEHSEEERELAAGARGSDRKLPDSDPARRGSRRREPDRREADLRRQSRHPARGFDGVHGAAAARVRHPHRDAGRRGPREVPHRRRAAAGDEADRQAVSHHDHLAHQGHGRTGHRREARAAGRPVQAPRPGQGDRLPRVDHAERARRGRRHPHPRQGVDERAVHRAAARHPRLARGRDEALSQVHPRAVRHGARHRAHRAAARPRRSTRRSPRSRRSRTRSSRSKTRSSISFAGSRRFRSTRRKG